MQPLRWTGSEYPVEVGISPQHNRPTNHHDRVVVYASFLKDEIGIDLEEQIEAARKDAKKHDAKVIMEIAECVRRKVPIMTRSGLRKAIRTVRGLGRRGVLVLGAPSQVGTLMDLALLLSLVEDTGGGVAGIAPLTHDRAEHFHLISLVDTMRKFAEEREKLRRCDDVFALRRTMSWPLDPGAPKDG